MYAVSAVLASPQVKLVVLTKLSNSYIDKSTCMCVIIAYFVQYFVTRVVYCLIRRISSETSETVIYAALTSNYQNILSHDLLCD